MERFTKKFFENRRLILNSLINDYNKQIEKARIKFKTEIHYNIYRDTDKQYLKLQSEFSPNGYEVWRDFEKVYGSNSESSIENSIIECTKNDKPKLRDSKLIYVSTLKAYEKFFAYLRHKEKAFNLNDKTNDRSNNEITANKKLKIQWTNGRNKNEFVKIVYALFHAKLINNGEGNITEIIKELDEFFNVGLGNNYNSNLSTHILDTSGENEMKIFKRMSDAFEHYANEVKERKERNKTKRN
jgi:hypothetical protein